MKIEKIEDCFVLENGKKIPCIGYGTWKVTEEEAITCVKKALEVGYRHIDTAAFYGNEKPIGEAVRGSGLRRNQIFLTSKVWNQDRGYEKTMAAFQETLKNLGFSYLDLYLIHWPAAEHQFTNWEEINADTWRALEQLYDEGKIEAIGVSNFKPHHLEALMKKAKIRPMVNQIEYHPGYPQTETVKYCKEHGILVEAWSPFGRGTVLENEVLQEIAEKYHRTTAQICLRWALQHGVLPLPKSSDENRQKINIQVFDFSLGEEDMKKIDEMPECGFSGQHPDTIAF